MEAQPEEVEEYIAEMRATEEPIPPLVVRPEYEDHDYKDESDEEGESEMK